MNALIQEIAAQGKSQEVYELVNTASLILALLYGFWHGKKLGIPLWKMFFIQLALYLGMNVIGNILWELVLYIRNNEIFGIQTAVNSIVRIFIFVPVIGILVTLLFRLLALIFPKVKPLKLGLVWDASIIYPLLRSALAQIACVFTGCCAGPVMSWVIYNRHTGLYHFPVQLLETVLTLVVFVWLLCRLRKHKYKSDGLYMPCMFIGYGIVRFICEAIRDNEKLLPLCSAVGVHALILCIVGVFWLLIAYVIRHTGKKETKKI